MTRLGPSKQGWQSGLTVRVDSACANVPMPVSSHPRLPRAAVQKRRVATTHRTGRTDAARAPSCRSLCHILRKELAPVFEHISPKSLSCAANNVRHPRLARSFDFIAFRCLCHIFTVFCQSIGAVFSRWGTAIDWDNPCWLFLCCGCLGLFCRSELLRHAHIHQHDTNGSFGKVGHHQCHLSKISAALFGRWKNRWEWICQFNDGGQRKNLGWFSKNAYTSKYGVGGDYWMCWIVDYSRIQRFVWFLSHCLVCSNSIDGCTINLFVKKNTQWVYRFTSAVGHGSVKWHSSG